MQITRRYDFAVSRENEMLAGTWHDLWQGAGIDVKQSLLQDAAGKAALAHDREESGQIVQVLRHS